AARAVTDTEIMIRSKNRPSAFAMSHLLVVGYRRWKLVCSVVSCQAFSRFAKVNTAQAKCLVVFVKIGKYFLRGKFRVNSRKEPVPIVSNVQALRFVQNVLPQARPLSSTEPR